MAVSALDDAAEALRESDAALAKRCTATADALSSHLSEVRAEVQAQRMPEDDATDEDARIDEALKRSPRG